MIKNGSLLGATVCLIFMLAVSLKTFSWTVSPEDWQNVYNGNALSLHYFLKITE